MFRKTFILFSLVVFFSFVGPPVVSAAVGIDPELHPQGAPTVTGGKAETEKDLKPEDITRKFTANIVAVLFGIAGTVAIFFILNNAWYLVISAGSEEKIGQHKKGIMWAIIGLILIILSYSIVRFVISIPFQADEAVLNKTAEAGGGAAGGGGAAAEGGAPATPPAP